MDINNLYKLPIEELRTLAVQHGIKPHHKAKAETIAKLIIDAVTNTKTQDTMKHESQIEKGPAKINTEEEVRQACATHFAKEGFLARFDDDNWYFSCRGAEDSGHMSVPLRVIKMKAENVSRGARSPAMVSIDGEKIMAA